MIPDFPEMWKLIPEGECGTATVKHFEISKENQSARMLIRPDEYIPPGKYAQLLVHKRVMMSDTPMERRTNSHVLRYAQGDVLIGGLGLGMLVFPLLAKKEVKTLTIVEKNPDVYDLILPHMPDDPRLAVFEDDIFTWKPHRPKFNTIYFDIWPDVTTDNLEGMGKLHRRYGRFLDRTGAHWMGSWQHDLLLSRRRREVKQERRLRWW